MKKKLILTLTLTLCAVALIVGSVAGTLAYLRATADVSNTFTYGQISITMDETQIDADGKTPLLNANRVVGNNYLLTPNTTYKKDPVIHIKAESQKMYLFVKIDNGIAGLAVENSDDQHLTIHSQMLANGWKVYTGENGVTYQNRTETPTNSTIKLISTSTVYYLSVGADVAATEAAKINATYKHMNIETAKAGDVPTFTSFTTGTGPVTEASMTAYVNNNAKVVVTAYAVQAEAEDFATIHDAAAVFAGEWTSAIPTTNP